MKFKIGDVVKRIKYFDMLPEGNYIVHGVLSTGYINIGNGHGKYYNTSHFELITESTPTQTDLKRGYWTASNIVAPRAIWDGDIKDIPVPTPTTGAVKHDQGKPDMTMIPFCALEEVAKALGHGKKKYGRNNYQSGINTTRLAASALRHLGSWCDGVDLDTESGEQHLACATANLLMLLWTIKNKPELDDR